jgi:3-isopropylmalate dehydrogenase
MPETGGRTLHIAVIAGDGIGPEVVDAALPAIVAAAAGEGTSLAISKLPYGAEHFLQTGETMPDHVFERLTAEADAIFLGALGDPRVPSNEHARDILLGLRFRLDLYVNFRPCRLLHPDLCPLRPPTAGARRIDFAIFRENTEGLYLGRGTSSDEGTEDEVHVAHEVHSAKKVERIITAAFTWAQRHGRPRVTMADKSNAVPAHRLWGRVFDRVAAAFPDVEAEHRYVDALAMELVRDPDRFEVIVTGNLFGDILSDLGAELVGGLGLSPSANVHPGRLGLFEPVHGSAPPLVGTGKANPLAAILTGALMLDHLGLPHGAARLEGAVRSALAERITTPDLGGTYSTTGVGEWIADRVSGD